MAVYHRLVAGDLALSARATRARERFGAGPPCDGFWDVYHREELERWLKTLPRNRSRRPDPIGFGLPDDAIEDYPDQWAIDYAYRKASTD
ncbi:hypothetical protein ACFVVU_36105 [Kitasatospora sp. NPDC057965]|uniref:hypothetical protein n=1 Tax=Kitasatospora sp. NPDC057965 TaxID=3346291 RepID=UPI0036DCD3CA